MFSVQDFVSKFEKYNDQELFEINSNSAGYSAEAKQAFFIVIEKRGGIEPLLQRIAERKTAEEESERLKEEVTKLIAAGSDITFIKSMINSEIISKESVDLLIEEKFSELAIQKEDETIKPRTIIGSVAGVAISGIAGGILWGMLMVYSQKVVYFGFAALVFFSYRSIKMFTRQSNRNIVVLLSTVIAAIIIALLGQLIYETMG